MEEYARDLHDMHHHNQKLINRHGHEEAPKLKEKGMFNYADYMDVTYIKKAEKLSAEQVKMMTKDKKPMDFSHLGQK